VDKKELYLSWLNDAYSMEQGLIPILQNHANDAKDFPAFQAKYQEHLDQTRRHADMVKGCIDRLGGKVNPIKTGIGQITGAIQGITTAVARDEVVKNAISDFAVENFEVASYLALIQAAQDLGDRETSTVCEQIRREDSETADWFERNIPGLITEFFQRFGTRTQAA
jgi:ferritin-like metal-binding protein YciE